MFLLDKNHYYYVWFFTCAHIQIFFYIKKARWKKKSQYEHR